MAFCDFVIKYDPTQDTGQDLFERIIYSIIIKRLKSNKPAVVFIGGDSGEGKSLGAIRLMEILFKVQNLDLTRFFDDINVYTPLEYSEKFDRLLFDEGLKKVNVLCMHEAREVVKAKNWHTFLNQSVADVNAMSRSVKRMCMIVISQFIRDISSDIRYTINFYIVVRRPKGKRARMYINVLWKDDRDIDKPRLRKRKLSGYLVYPDGKYRRFVPKYFELNKPSKEFVERFNKSDVESKALIIRSKLNKLITEMKLESGQDSGKLDAMVDWYAKNPDSLHLVGKVYRGKWRVKPDIMRMHDLSKLEAKAFQEKLNNYLKSKGVVDLVGVEE